ncbi:MAG TPA: hypothetical protein VFE31_15480 [Opitutaceae bacterium]|jgi:hypothetical protein|nr:hypothetical protein [Opitutaceae bacterium]
MTKLLLAAAFAAAAGASAQTVNLAINAASVVRPVDDRQFSINTAIWDGDLPNSAAQVSPLAIRALRFPGGSASDGFHWSTNTSDIGTYVATNFDAFESFAQALPAQVMITANYGDGTPQEAASWVQYANVTKKYGVKYWEIGNEIYGSWEHDINTPAHDPVEYATRAAQYISQMKAVDPTIRIGLVVITGEDMYPSGHSVVNPVTQATHSGWTPVMLSTLKTLGVTPDFVAYHRYEEQTGTENDANLLQDAVGWISDAQNLRMQLNDYLGAAGANVEILATENNSNGETSGQQTTSLVNGLYLADSIGNLLQTEINGWFWWDLRNEQSPPSAGGYFSPNLYGWRPYGDQGILSGTSTFYPTYYVEKLLSHFARGGDTVVSATSSSTLLSVYAAKRHDGSLSVLVINKSPAAATSATIALSGFTPAAAATVYSYGIPQDNAAEAETNASEPEGSDADVQVASNVAISGATFTASFGPYSVTLYSIPPAQGASAGAHLINISSSGYVGVVPNTDATEHTIEAGFIIGGSGTEEVLIRGIGPTLKNFGVSTAASDVQLTVYDVNNNPLKSNHGWSSGSTTDTQALQAAFSATGAFSLNLGTLDSALLITLPPGNYTAEVTGGANGVSGTVLAEVYEVSAQGTRLTNLSSRGYVDSSGHGLIDGFYVGGSGGQEEVLLRAVGPTLSTSFNVNPAVADPALKILTSPANVLIATNDDWSAEPDSGISAAISATGAFALPTLSRDAAAVITLPNGGYSAQSFGTNGPAGDAIVEIYEVAQ